MYQYGTGDRLGIGMSMRLFEKQLLGLDISCVLKFMSTGFDHGNYS